MPKQQKERYGAFLLYVDDWLSSTAIELMTAAEERGYLRLLMHAWKAEDCGLPDDDRILAVLSKLGDEWETSGSVLRKQFTPRDGRLYNDRLTEERDYQRNYRKTRKEAAEAGAAARWGLFSDASSNANAMPDHMRDRCVIDANPNPNPNSYIDIWFASEFWPLFPKKVSKPHALKAARAHVKGKEAVERVIQGLKRQLPTLRKQHADGFCPNPATWLNGERWNDEAAPVADEPQSRYVEWDGKS